MNFESIIIVLLAPLGAYRGWLFHNFINLRKNEKKESFFVFFQSIQIPQDIVKLVLISPIFSKSIENKEQIYLKWKINITTIIIYAMLLFAIIF